MRLSLPLSTVALLVLAACGGGQEAPQVPTEGDPGGARPAGPQLGMDAEIGALDEGKVRSVFQKLSGKLSGCFEKGAGRLPYLAGEIRFHVRVDGDGRAKSVHATDSSLGDVETEECMMRALEGASWPTPQGGREGIAESPFAFDPGGGARPPVDLDEGSFGAGASKVKAVVAGCKEGGGHLKVTVYVETDGAVKAVGVSGDDASSRKAARCVADGVRGLSLPSPGSYAGKLVVSD